MRKLSTDHKKYILRRAKLLFSRKIVSKRKRKLRNCGLSRKTAVVLEGGRTHRTKGLRAIALPKVLCLDDNIAETLKALGDIHQLVLDQCSEAARAAAAGRKLQPTRRYFDFQLLEKIGPSAALVLAAIYERAKAVTGKKLWTVNEHKWDPQVVSVLRALGFHELLEMQPLRKGWANTGPVRIQRFISGQRADGEPAGRLQEALAALLPEMLRDSFFTTEPYGGMLEAILNSYMWAYPRDHEWEHPVLTNWWLTGAVNVSTNEVVVVVYDQGVSIPFSLPHWRHWSKLEKMAKRAAARLGLTPDINDPRNDGAAIRMAMQIAKTATRLPQHGKGLHTMVEVAERARFGRLRVLSRNGEFIWETGKRPRSLSYPDGLHGTLIEWQLKF